MDDKYLTGFGVAVRDAERATSAALAAVTAAMHAHGDRDPGPEWSALHSAWQAARTTEYVFHVLANGGEFPQDSTIDVHTEAQVWHDAYDATGRSDDTPAWQAVMDAHLVAQQAAQRASRF